MNESERNKLNYVIEKASTGETVESHASKAEKRLTRSTVRLTLRRSQQWQGIQLVQALGGNPAGMSYARVFQLLIDSLINTKIKEGLIEPIDDEAADKLLKEWSNQELQDIGDVDIDLVKEIEKETERPQANSAYDAVTQALQDATRKESEEGITDFFDFKE